MTSEKQKPWYKFDEHIHWLSAIPGVIIFTGVFYSLKFTGLPLGWIISTWLAAALNFCWWGGREWLQARRKYNEWVEPIDWSRQKQMEFIYPVMSGTMTSLIITVISGVLQWE
jgi:hypothetical protein